MVSTSGTQSERLTPKSKIQMWAQVINAVLGIWLMAAPAVFGYGDPAQANDRIFGPIIATFAIVAWWEATHNIRWANIPLGAWLVLAPWVLGYDATAAMANSMVVGGIVVGLSFVKARVTKRYGGGWRALFQEEPMHLREAEAGRSTPEV